MACRMCLGEQRSVCSMLYPIAVVLLILWLHGLVGRRSL